MIFYFFKVFNEYHPAKIPRIPIGKVAMPEIIDKYEPVLVLLIIKRIPPVTDKAAINRFIIPIQWFMVEQ